MQCVSCTYYLSVPVPYTCCINIVCTFLYSRGNLILFSELFSPKPLKNDLFNSPSDTVSNCSNGNPARAEIGAELGCTAFIHFPVVNLRYFLFYFGHFFSRDYCFLAFCYNCLCSKLNQILSKSSNFHTICRFSRISISSGS